MLLSRSRSALDVLASNLSLSCWTQGPNFRALWAASFLQLIASNNKASAVPRTFNHLPSEKSHLHFLYSCWMAVIVDIIPASIRLST